MTLAERRFGICDTEEHKPAYIAAGQGEDWIASVDNFYCETIGFVPVDHCIELNDKRCDGFLFHDNSIMFVELKDRKGRHSHEWLKDAYNQLRTTISYFERECDKAKMFTDRRAYVSNRRKPHFQSSQMTRIESFRRDAGYTLRISTEIKVHEI